MRRIKKNIFLNTLFCPVYGWMLYNDMIDEESSIGNRFRMEQGISIGEKARAIFPGGILIDGEDTFSPVDRTSDLLVQPSTTVLFEATFYSRDFIAKADILIRDGTGWELIEVKSGTNDKEEYIDDMAYTAMVMAFCSIPISKVSLMLVSKDYRLGMSLDFLFLRKDHTEKVMQKVEMFKSACAAVEETIALPDPPTREIQFTCKDCPVFTQCHGEGIENYVFTIPRVSQKKFDMLLAQGVVRIEDVPPTFSLTPNQQRVVQCIQCDEVLIDQSLSSNLDQVRWPARYLDFETTMTALPLYSGIAPYQQIPIQYSIHTCADCGNVLDHRYYLADPEYCRCDLAERLLSDLDGDGSIIVYSSFEKRVIDDLTSSFPQLSQELQSLVQRFVDLEKIIKLVNHPKFKGRTSIKVALPALVPELSYDYLPIANGDDAMATFAYMAQGYFPPDIVKEKKEAMLEYCKLDTYAMVKLHQALEALSGGK